MANSVPDRGDILWVDFHPTVGREQDLERPALVLSPWQFNKKFSLALVAPITSKVRGHGFEVLLEGCKTEGAILCQQIRTIDFADRKAAFIEKAPAFIINDVLAKVVLLVR